MKILNRDTVTAVVATVFASGIIFSTGSGSAEEKLKISTESSSKASIKKVVTTPVKKVASSTTRTDDLLAPPPGPFFNQETSTVAQQILTAPKAPKAPVSLAAQPELRANSIHFNKTMPVLSQKLVEPDKKLQKPMAPSKEVVAPKLSLAAPVIKPNVKAVDFKNQAPKLKNAPSLKIPPPEAPKNVVKQPSVNSIERPIWMQNKVAGKSVNPVANNQAVMGMPKMNWANGYPMQQYIYVPVPIMPSNMVAPQMPRFNQNIIPPSNYWGATQMPSKIQNIEMPKTTMDGKSTSIQKGNKE